VAFWGILNHLNHHYSLISLPSRIGVSIVPTEAATPLFDASTFYLAGRWMFYQESVFRDEGKSRTGMPAFFISAGF